MTARDLLAKGVERAEALADQPEVQARLLLVIGETYHRPLWSIGRNTGPGASAIERALSKTGQGGLRMSAARRTGDPGRLSVAAHS